MKKVLSFFIIEVIILVCLLNNTYASLNLKINTLKKDINIGEMEEITVDWEKGMQAADFSLIYDSNKMEFMEANIDQNFYKQEDGEIKVSWISINGMDKSNIEFKFKAIDCGDATFKTKVNDGFATGNLEIQKDYTCDNQVVKVLNKNKTKMIAIYGVISIIIIFLIILILKNKMKGRKQK